MKKRVTIESPYAGNVERNMIYAKQCLLDSLMRDEAPYASHLLYTLVLDDLQPEERQKGLDAAMTFVVKNDLSAVYTDYGISRGMYAGIIAALDAGVDVRYRELASLRQTGRTTAMVEEAVIDLKEGKNVLIFSAHERQSSYILEMIRSRVDVSEVNVWVRPVHDWANKTIGLRPNSVFVDHHSWSQGIVAYEALVHFSGVRS